MRFFFDKIRRFFIDIEYLSVSRINNLLKLICSYLFSFTGRLWQLPASPHFLSVEPVNFCNLHCPECPVGVRNILYTERRHFDFELYKKLIDNQKRTLQHVIFYFQGEPFLNRQLPEFIRYAHEARIYTSTSTNGQFINKMNAKDVLLAGLDKLIVSVDGTSQEVYEAYRVGGKLEKALEGIREIVSLKREMKLPTPLVEIQFLVLKTNEHQLTEMKHLAQKLGVDRLSFKSAQLHDFEHGNRFLTSIAKYARYRQTADGRFVIKNKLPNRCWRLWSGAVVNVSGEVLPCCFDKNSEYSFGNINSNSLDECWLSNEASGFRERILQNRKQFEMCRNCTGK